MLRRRIGDGSTLFINTNNKEHVNKIHIVMDRFTASKAIKIVDLFMPFQA